MFRCLLCTHPLIDIGVHLEQEETGGLYQHGDLTHKTCLNPFSMTQIAKLSGFQNVTYVNEGFTPREMSRPKEMILRMLQGISTTTLTIQSIVHFKSRIPLTPNFISILAK